MPNAFDYDPCRPSNSRFFAIGACAISIAILCTATAVAKSKGRLDDLVRVTAEMVDVGDGLPTRSDVKFRGVLVGSVTDVVAAQHDQPNIVSIDIKPEFAAGIPATVTARVVPSNVFAVSSIQLLEGSKGSAASGHLRTGTVIHEDASVPTLVFQSALNKARELFGLVGRESSDNTVGVLTALGEATAGRGTQMTAAGGEINEIIKQLDGVVGPGNEGSTMAAFTDAVNSLQTVAPRLVDTLSGAIKPMRTFAEKRDALNAMLTAGQSTAGTLGAALSNQADRLINVTTELAPVIGVLADRAPEFPTMFTKVDNVARKFYEEGWNPVTNTFLIKATVSFTPSRTYVRADCPRYGDLEGPSCKTSPEVPTAPALLPGLAAKGILAPPYVTENRPNLAPPRGSMNGAGTQPGPAPAGEPVPPADGQVTDVHQQAVRIGGTVGSVGSNQERAQLSYIVGSEANSADQLLLGPLARGTTVHVTPEGEDGR